MIGILSRKVSGRCFGIRKDGFPKAEAKTTAESRNDESSRKIAHKLGVHFVIREDAANLCTNVDERLPGAMLR